jgi:hypothetical protein
MTGALFTFAAITAIPAAVLTLAYWGYTAPEAPDWMDDE